MKETQTIGNKNMFDRMLLFGKSYDDDLPDMQYFLSMFGVIGSKKIYQNDYDKSILKFFENKGFKTIVKTEIPLYNKPKRIKYLLINEDKRMIVSLSEVSEKTKPLLSLYFIYDLEYGEFEEQFNENELKVFEVKKEKSNISLVISERGNLDTQDYNLIIPEIDIELNYGDGFKQTYDKIISRLNTKMGKGIVLLHGDPGTGKTTFLKYLTSQIKDKEILFIPPSMAEVLSEPSIIPFLMYKQNSILIIEDAERVISQRGKGDTSSTGVSNLLNITDGILGDCLGIQVVATFNMSKEKIDEALLRKGRLIAEHKFEKLPVESTNKLLKHLNKDFISDVELSLADIYNIEDADMRTTKDGGKIGFKR